ncbi:hypothetical protein Taro_034624, partial [Colocasia esculenta]|nr:hypothetical protein [Colocasia esculenta]
MFQGRILTEICLTFLDLFPVLRSSLNVLFGTRAEIEVRSSEPGSTTPPVAKKTLEVVIPGQAVPSLMMRSGNKLAQINEMSRAKVSLIKDRPELTEKVVQICGSAKHAERAQSLLQGFILSSKFLV